MTLPTHTFHLGDCFSVMQDMAEGSVDAIVTDPPYGISFMGKAWDGKDIVTRTEGRRQSASRDSGAWNNTGGHDSAASAAGLYDLSPKGMRAFQEWTADWGRQAIRVMKPGAHLVVFASPRTYHRMVCGLEEAGFEIRDQLLWLFSSGFPKSRNLDRERGNAICGCEADEPQTGGAWPICRRCGKPILPKGLGTALKPAHEPICLARKPLIGTVTANVLAHGTGALNIDACRVPITSADDAREFDYNHNGCNRSTVPEGGKLGMHDGGWKVRKGDVLVPEGRWPANLIHDGSPEVVALFPAKAGGLAPVTGNESSPASRGTATGERARVPWIPHGDTGSAARFFYCAKITRGDRNEGLEGRDKKALNWSSGTQSPGTFQSPGTDKTAENHHPTVKPTELMAYLVCLVTPPNGTVLDPFMGSGSTGKACMREGFNFVGIELDPEYVEIARARIEWARPRQFGLQLEPTA